MQLSSEARFGFLVWNLQSRLCIECACKVSCETALKELASLSQSCLSVWLSKSLELAYLFISHSYEMQIVVWHYQIAH